MTFILALYSAILVTFLFGRWVRLEIRRRQARRVTLEDALTPDWKEFLRANPPLTPTITLSQVEAEVEVGGEGEVVRGFEVEMDQSENEEVEESVEEREWREEEMVKLKRGSRR